MASHQFLRKIKQVHDSLGHEFRVAEHKADRDFCNRHPGSENLSALIRNSWFLMIPFQQALAGYIYPGSFHQMTDIGGEVNATLPSPKLII